jgi:hypothetical protein
MLQAKLRDLHKAAREAGLGGLDLPMTSANTGKALLLLILLPIYCMLPPLSSLMPEAYG